MAAGDGPWHLLANLGSFLHRKRLDPLAQSLDVMLEVRVYDFDITASAKPLVEVLRIKLEGP